MSREHVDHEEYGSHDSDYAQFCAFCQALVQAHSMRPTQDGDDE